MQECLALLLLWFTKWVVIPLLVLCLLHAMVNMRLLRRLAPMPLAPSWHRTTQDVSVLVPARNEERLIRACLESLAVQEPPVREIILLDDRSTDRTAEIALELGFREEAGSPRRLLRGRELPDGWVGKNWACHQLSAAADPGSSHLLFTDADTIHHASCVRTSLAHARAERADLLSLWPDQITGTWSEKLVIPLGYLLFMAFHPFPLLGWLQADPSRTKRWGFTRGRLAALGAANGQFLMFTRDSYAAIGGHEALRDHLVEDIAFGRRVASRTGEGMRLVNADGIDLLKCRMYTGFGELWEGFSKNLRPVFEESHLSFLLFGIVIFSLFLLPFLLLMQGGFSAPWIAVGLILLTRFLLTLRFRTSWLGFIAHPAGIALALLIALNSWRLCLRRGIVWKGRIYSGATRSVLD
ncbi:MAG: glycosyltransferase family 2 protein [Verrucomicrobia bacterium]|nr:glycosyltransferase family 2 protein [Verrucomicrobiota bacterium]